MPPLNVLIKPASSLRSLNCSYCFYRDVSSHRQNADYGIMSLDTLEQVGQRISEYADTECTIAWQGGEPTLAGLSFFQTYLELEKSITEKKYQCTGPFRPMALHWMRNGLLFWQNTIF